MIEFNCTGDYKVIEPREYQIEGVNYEIHTGFNNRSGWYVSIYDLEGTSILTGLTLINEPQNITWRYSRNSGKLFTGDMWILSRDGDYEKLLTKDNFGEGKDWGLFYFTKAEMLAYGINKR